MKTRFSKSVGFIPLLLLVALPVVARAQYNYTTAEGRITITAYNGPGGDVNIPNTIDGLPVTAIGDLAFQGDSPISITIPPSLTSIAPSAFNYSPGLREITVDGLNPSYSSVDGILFNKSQTLLILHPRGKTNQSYTIPDSVTSIGDNSFSYCAGLTNITLSDKVTSIGSAAFAFCMGLTRITIPSSVTTISWEVFFLCARLTAITVDGLNPNFSSVDGVLFNKSQTVLIRYPEGKDGDYTVPNSVRLIEASAFLYCYSLTNVTIPNSVIHIGNSAFSNCGRLTTVTIPSSVVYISGQSFFGCTSLSAIMVDELNPDFSSVNGVLFNKSQTVLIQYPAGKTGDYVVPDGVSSIGQWAFASSAKLRNVTIPNSVTSIGSFAFYFCGELKELYFLGNCPNHNNSSLSDSYQATIHYLPGAAGWSSIFAGRPAKPRSYGVLRDQFVFTINRPNESVVVVEASENLEHPVWKPVGTNTLTDGLSYFIDPQWTNHATRFYRMRRP